MTVADLVLIGLAVTLEPVPIAGFILVLASRRGTAKGFAYILGWMGSLVFVIAITVVITEGRAPRPSTDPSIGISAAKAGIGAALVVFALYRHRHPRQRTGSPRWASGLDHISLFWAAALGALLQPWALVGAGADVVAGMNVPSAVSVLLLAGFCLLATATPIAMECYTVLSRDAATRRLDRIRHTLESHRERAVVLIATVAGLWLLGNGLAAVAAA